jgi:4-amino-4-deoxy-L-arabinose transferase-like glycosyltransferase
LNPEHPPLVKILSGLPLLFLDLKLPDKNQSFQNEVNGQWNVGREFLYESGNSADKIIFWSRIGPIILTLVLLTLIYWWSRELLGGFWAFLPLFLFAASPVALAHGHYVTTDVGAALGVVSALFLFIRFLFRPSRSNLVWAGIGFGLAQLTKFSAVFLLPLFLVLTAVFYLASVIRDWRQTAFIARFKRFGVRAWRYVRSVLIIFAIGYPVVYAVNFVFTIN